MSQLTIFFEKAEDCAWAMRQINACIVRGSRLQGASAGILLDTLPKAHKVESPTMQLADAIQLTSYKG